MNREGACVLMVERKSVTSTKNRMMLVALATDAKRGMFGAQRNKYLRRRFAFYGEEVCVKGFKYQEQRLFPQTRSGK